MVAPISAVEEPIDLEGQQYTGDWDQIHIMETLDKSNLFFKSNLTFLFCSIAD